MTEHEPFDYSNRAQWSDLALAHTRAELVALKRKLIMRRVPVSERLESSIEGMTVEIERREKERIGSRETGITVRSSEIRASPNEEV
jgi:hypothetical protein